MTGRPGPASSQNFNASQPSFVNPPIGIGNVPAITTPRFGPGQVQRGIGVLAPTPFVRRTPGFILGTVPFRHRPWFFHRHPGIVFYDVPSYFDTTIVTPYAPYDPYAFSLHHDDITRALETKPFASLITMPSRRSRPLPALRPALIRSWAFHHGALALQEPAQAIEIEINDRGGE